MSEQKVPMNGSNKQLYWTVRVSFDTCQKVFVEHEASMEEDHQSHLDAFQKVCPT